MTSDEQKAVELVREYARAENQWEQEFHNVSKAQSLLNIERKLRDIGEKLLQEKTG